MWQNLYKFISPSFLFRPGSLLLVLALTTVILASLFGVGAAAQNPNVSAGESPQTPPNATANGRLGVGDMVEVSVYEVPELATKARIGDNGDLYLPLIGYVPIAGLSVEEAQALIEKRLADGGFVKNPHVELLRDQQGAQGVSVLGQIAKPGVYPVLGPMRLFDLISAAGGLTDRAGRSATITHRNQPDKPETVELERNLEDKPESNVAVLAGDTVVVRKADVVYVVGEVGRPSGFLMETGHLTVLQAIAMAGGTTRTAKLSGVRIIRKGPTGMTETTVPLQKILSAKAPDVTMEADDILFVPNSAAKAFAGRTLEVATQAASAAAIIALP